MENHSECPNCGRNLTEDERYCYFCEAELPDTSTKNKKKREKSKR